MNTRYLCLFVLPLCGILTAGEAERRGFIGKGTDWETPVYFRDTGKPGPTVMIVGGVHGNEPAGARAANQIRHWPLVKGKLIAIPRANVAGLGENTRYLPGAPKEQRDLNRNFPGERLSDGTRGKLAGALWMQILKYKPDWLFDLHEGFQFNLSHQPKDGKAKSVGSSIIYFKGKEMDPLVRRMQAAANATASDPDRKFALIGRGPKQTGMVNAAIRHLKIKGMILETTYQYQRLAVRTRQHRAMMSVALRELGLIDRDCADVMTPGNRKGHLFIGLYDGSGSSEGGINNVAKVLERDSGITVARIDPRDVRSEVMSQFDAMVFSGGSGSKQAATIGKEAAKAVRAYVKDGGGYLGICAGAFLCSAQYSWSLDLVDTHVFTGSREIEGVGRKSMWYRGKTSKQKMQLTEAGKKLFADIPERVEVSYHNGPIVSPKNLPELPGYNVLAHFRSEQVLYPPQKGTMIDTPAIVEGQFGDGRVIAISPHPEATKGLETIIASAVKAIARDSD
ncbi:MAG: BPL-N domain-containing protein [Limisphaerales bacterium]